MTDRGPGAPGPEASAPVAAPLTAAVIAPGWALAYGAAVLALNVTLQLGARSEAVLAPLRVLVSGAAGSSSASRALAAAVLSALITIASYALMLVPAAALAVTARRRGVGLAAALGLHPTGVGRTLRLSALIVVGGFATVAMYASVARMVGVTVEGNTAGLVASYGMGWAEMALAFVLVGIVAPFVEEVTFRGIVFPSLRAAWGTAPAMLVSGAIFGVVHLQLTIAIPLALLGMALAAVFLRTRSLWTAIAAHCAYNTVSLAIAFAVVR